MIVEAADPRRALGAVRFVDATTGLRITEPLRVEAPGVRWARTLQGWYAILSAPLVNTASGSLESPPAAPAVGSTPLLATVEDPSGRYLPRRCTVPFPRDPDPAHADEEDSLFRPVAVRLFRSSLAPTAPGWAVVRAQVRDPESGAPLPGALVRVVRFNPPEELLASGLADARGEALVAVPGIPITTWAQGPGPGPVLATRVEAWLHVSWDPEAGPLPDPDDLEARRDELLVGSRRATLQAGQLLVTTL